MISSKGLEHAKIETALRESEERLRLAIEASGIGIFSIDLSSGVAHYSPELSRILGFPAVAEARLEDAFVRVYRDEQARVRKQFAEALDPASGGRLDMNFRFVRPGGEVRWMSWSGRVHFDEESVPRKPVRIVGTCVDTTERLEAEARLRASEARLTSEAQALTKLNTLSSRLWRTDRLQEGLEEMLAVTIELLGADMGDVQLLDAKRGVLTIAAQQAFGADFLEHFREVSIADECACGRALRTGERILIEDVETDVAYGQFRTAARAAGYRSVQSTPLIGRDGRPLGVLSTFWRSPYQPSDQDLRRLELYIRQAADFVERFRLEERLRQNERRQSFLLNSAIDCGRWLIRRQSVPKRRASWARSSALQGWHSTRSTTGTTSPLPTTPKAFLLLQADIRSRFTGATCWSGRAKARSSSFRMFRSLTMPPRWRDLHSSRSAPISVFLSPGMVVSSPA